nr:retrovirus-related Pol polyprotein from transposon TNT 1-94 [Tanacetum cinerariifolium]
EETYCFLYIPSSVLAGEKVACATATVYAIGDATVHFKKLLKGHTKVSVIKVVKIHKSMELPVSDDKIPNLESAVKGFIQWPNAAIDRFTVSAMQEELDHFARLKVWRLVPRPDGKTIIKTKWIFKNKKDESSLVIQNKSRLIAVGYSQQEGIDYDETFAPVSRIKVIRLFLAYAAHKDFTVFQMDVKRFLMELLRRK